MPNFTKEQLEAINTSGSNIIVSAGAGSGKTAVLTERVVEKIKQGVSIDQLLVLTFTHAAALEMKNRVRDKIKKIDSLKEELHKLDSSYITTFDSYSLSVVKKYHYLLNITNHVSICESSLIELKKKEFIEEIFNNYYDQEDPRFLKLISDFCVKDDDNIKKQLLNIYDKIQMRYDKVSYLEKYIENNFTNEKISNDIELFEKFLLNKINQIEQALKELSGYVDSNYYDDIFSSISSLLSASNYDDIVKSIPEKIKAAPRGSSSEVKYYKGIITDIIKELKEICLYNNREDIKNIILSTKDYIDVITNILLELDSKLRTYKNDRELFEFTDIAHLAIKLVDCYPEVRGEIKDQFKEILVDEYQDTNDLQELFLSFIGNNNIYMVGDIKQSIYRFRNANPDIFKEKYNKYANNIDGIKIDLNKNFRSRKEVVNNINYIFDKVMDNYLGQAEYQDSHRMVFGNELYEKEKDKNQSSDFTFLNYEYDKTSNYSKDELEVFTVAHDIKDKVESKYKVFDKKTNTLREVTYSDFAILIDRSRDFELYKKVFEYLHIPLTIYKDDEVSESTDIYVIANLLKLLKKIKDNNYDQVFKYSFVSVLRSFLYGISDEEIFDYIVNENYDDSDLVKKIKEVLEEITTNSPKEIINILLDKFNYYEKIITYTDVRASLTRIDYIKDLTKNITSVGYSIYDLSDILEEILQQELRLQIPNVSIDSNSCKIMTIHKSKGLEFPICYYAGLSRDFNISELKDMFIYDSTFGIVTPYFKEGIGDTIYKYLLKDNYMQNEISERIRLFYVSLTRCREKMIFITSFGEERDIIYKDKNIVSDYERLRYRSFQDILNSIYSELMPFIKNVDIEKLNLTKDYNLTKNNNYLKKIDKTDEKIEFINNSYSFIEEDNSHFSKTTNELLSEEIISNMEFGTKMHYYFELLNFKTKDTSYILDNDIRKRVDEFLKLDILKDVDRGKVYKEYEFLYEEDNTIYHGIIDLMIEYDSYIDIIDYKLSNVDDPHYEEQLHGYKKYIENRTGKRVNLYLYSIIKKELRSIS